MTVVYLIILLILNLLDAAGTWYALSVNYGIEANPIMAFVIVHFGWIGFFIFKALLVGSALIWLYKLRHIHPTAIKWILFSLIVVYGLNIGYQIVGLVFHLKGLV